MFFLSVDVAAQESPGSIRGVVYDQDFDVPLGSAQVLVVETGQRAATTDQGHFVLPGMAPGTYTLVFSKDGYVRQVRAGVTVVSGQLTDVDVELTGEFTEMDEFVVQDILLTPGSEGALLQIRFDSASLMDSVSADFMSRAGVSDAAGALTLVTGATVEDGKFAVIRGLPDRYVSSQMNGVRLPSADEDKRAVELDQFPAAVIESVQVSKTFTPDQQGDASGGAVDVRLKSIPDETQILFSSQLSYNTNVRRRDDFLTYRGGGVSSWGTDDGDRDIQPVGPIGPTGSPTGANWEGAVGVSEDDAPTDYKWSLGAGGKHVFDNGVKVGGLANFFYERDSQYYDDGIFDSYWVTSSGGSLVPETVQGVPDSGRGDFKTALFDVTQGSQSVQWGGLGTVGVETENHLLGLTYLTTWTTEDVATLAEDTRGKEFFFPGYDVDDLSDPGNQPSTLPTAPFIRTETLEYTERSAGTLQLNGKHTLPFDEFDIGNAFAFRKPELDWTVSHSSADLYQPDKRQFGSLSRPAFTNPGVPGQIPPSIDPPLQLDFKPGANFTFGNLQRIWKEIEEESEQYSANVKWPFEEWRGLEGYVKAGVFDDKVDRTFDQDSFSNFGDTNLSFPGAFDQFWSASFPFEQHLITPSEQDIDYEGEQDISAWYSMVDFPLASSLDVIGGARLESTEISIVNFPEPDATLAGVDLNPGDADVTFEQNDVLPAIGLVYEPVEVVTVRASYSETVARQTFKEITPILQQEYLGGPVFIGNPELRMSGLQNYDLRLDYTPYQGGLVSVSWFYKDVEDPIEYTQQISPSVGIFTTAVNYPEGTLSGYEVEVRQALDRFFEPLKGLSVGANATFIDSEVHLPANEIMDFQQQNIMLSITEREMTNAPEHLYNLYTTYDLEEIGTQFALFYTVKGDTLLAGPGASQTGNFVPGIYAKEYGTLNFSVSYRIGKHVKLQVQAKNLTNPAIEEVYRSDFTGGDVTRSSYTKGTEYSFGLSVTL